MRIWQLPGTWKVYLNWQSEGQFFPDLFRPGVSDIECRNAANRLGQEVKRFLKKADEEMGAKIFMLVGFKNQDGVIQRAKFSHLFILLKKVSTFCSHRAETDGPGDQRFTHDFLSHGKAVWQQWETHLLGIWQGWKPDICNIDRI